MKFFLLVLATATLAACQNQTASSSSSTSSETSQLQDIKPEDTEDWSVKPEQITFGRDGIPSDATILFDGTSLQAWEDKDGEAIAWENANGVLRGKPGAGDIRTKASFCDVQLHIEWRSPERGMNGESTGQLWGNSGVFLQGRYELQVLNSYDNPTYANGLAGSIYKQSPPLVNASKQPGEWQVYDIIFKAPIFADDGSLKTPARMTAMHNGVLIQNNVEIKGATTYIGPPKYKSHECAPLHLQDHGEAVEFRNIWLREL